jgi:cation transport ATPase
VTADVGLMRSGPLDVPAVLAIGRGTLRKMRQNLSYAIGCRGQAPRPGAVGGLRDQAWQAAFGRSGERDLP